jgi:hypothetical protein
MNTRILAVVCGAVGALPIAISNAWAQSAPHAAHAEASFSIPRTTWGDPNLEGAWDYRTITPLERRPELGDRRFYTEEEIAELEGRAAERMEQPPDEDTPANLVHAQYMTDPGRYLDESRRTSLIVDPPDGRIPALTPEAEARQARARAAGDGGRSADSFLDRTLMERCITRGLPGALLPGLYNNNLLISQAPGFVAITHEMIHETRIVPLDGREFSDRRAYLGESRGHWDGDTLVIETRNFNGAAPFRGAGENLRLTERYTRVGPDTIDFSLTFEDETHWTRPWTATYTMRPTDGGFYEYACHEGNYGLRNILQNARDEERAAAEAPGN